MSYCATSDRFTAPTNVHIHLDIEEGRQKKDRSVSFREMVIYQRHLRVRGLDEGIALAILGQRWPSIRKVE